MIPQRNSGKSGNGGWGGLSRACITIESCTKWEKNEGKDFFTEKWKNVYINLKCEQIAAKIGYLDESDKQGGLEYSRAGIWEQCPPTFPSQSSHPLLGAV